MSANVWQPGNEVINVDAESTNLSQVFVATENQVDFILTDFSYTPNTGSITVHRNGQKLIKGTDYTEATTTKVTLTGISLAVGEVVEITGIIGSTGANVVLAEAAAALAAASAGEAAASAASIDVSTLLAKSANLGDVADPATARVNLGAQAQLVSGSNIKTVNGQSLVGSGDVPISTAISDGDRGDIIVSGGGTVWTLDPSVVSHPLSSGTAIATTSGTYHDFTGIPSWVKRITIMVSGMSVSGSSIPHIQIGDSGGVETSGYLAYGTSNAHTTGYPLNNASNAGAATLYYGSVVLTLMDGTTNAWVCSVVMGINAGGAAPFYAGGAKSLTNTLDRIRLTTANGTDTFDAGSINILYE